MTQDDKLRDCLKEECRECSQWLDYCKDKKTSPPWHTGTPTESGEYLVCIRYDFGKEGYTTANYVEPYNPHTGWYNLKPPSEIDAEKWCKEHGIEVLAWQKIEPYKEKEE